MSERLLWVDRPGFYPDLDADRYFDDPAPAPSLTQSVIKVLNETSPHHAALEHPRLNPFGRRRDSSRAQFLGSAVHRLALGKGREVSMIRFPDYRSTAARDARDMAVANGRIPILEKTYAEAVRMAEVLVERIEERLEGAPYETEVPFFWLEETEAGPVWCRGMLDVWSEDLALGLDVKTTAGYATDEAVGRDIGSNGYDVQDSWYRRGVAKARPELEGRVSFEFLYVETSEPHGARPFELDEQSRVYADFQTERALRSWSAALHARRFPSYPRRTGVVSTPAYLQRKWADLAAFGDA